MKKGLILSLLLILIFGLSTANAAGNYLVDAEIEYLSVNESEVYFRGKNVSGSNPDGCTQFDLAMLSGDHGKFQAVYSMLLTAQSAKKHVKVYVNGCHNGYPKVATVHLLD